MESLFYYEKLLEISLIFFLVNQYKAYLILNLASLCCWLLVDVVFRSMNRVNVKMVLSWDHNENKEDAYPDM